MKKIITVQTPFGGKRIEAEPGDNLLDRLTAAGVLLRADCGGKAVCGKCLVKIHAAETFCDDATQCKLVGEKKYRSGFRVACKVKIQDDMTLEIPEDSTAIFEKFDKASLAAEFPDDFIPDSSLPGYGLAVDLGTTTIAVYLCQRSDGKTIAGASVKNPQSIFGEDVMSRISASMQNPENLLKLQQTAVFAVQQAARSLCHSRGVADKDVREMVVVGNPTMMHLFLGIDPSSLGTYPYRPAFTQARKTTAALLGFDWNPSLEIYAAPLVSGFIGSDAIAAALAVGMPNAPPGVMLVDVGTNGEVALCGKDALLAASCATGPAFEGASISCGMQAVSGAVDKVAIDAKTQQVRWSVIRQGEKQSKPIGICGSGVISAAAALRKAGMMGPDGRLTTNFEPIRSGPKGVEFVVVTEESSGTGQEIVLTQKDIRAIQLAKAALRAGIELLCKNAGFKAPEKIILSGAFGSFLPIDDALCIGMLPKIDPSKIFAAGNAAGVGAIMILVNHETRRQAEKLAQSIQTLDLAAQPDFEKTFVRAMAFD